MLQKLGKIFGIAYGYLDRHKTAILIILLLTIVLRFVWLNFINWQSGEISNGEQGVKFWLDSGRYLEGADKLLENGEFVGRENQYIGYMAVLAVFKMLSLSLNWVIIFQIIVAICAALALYDSAIRLGTGRFAALVASGLFLCNPFIVQWHQYILTESLYTSFVLLFLWSMIRLVSKLSAKNIIVSVIFLSFTMLLRPNGWILLPVFVCFLIFLLKIKIKFKIAIAAGVSLIFVAAMFGLGLSNKAIKITAPVKNMQDGVTVWNHHELYLDMPQEPELYTDNLGDGLKYIARHPFSAVKLGIVRAGYTLIHVRPFHSVNYKLRVLFYVLPAYFLALFAFLKLHRKKETLAALMIIAGHLLVVALTYAEHDSRFDIYILPVFYLFAAAGLRELIKLKYNRNLNQFRLVKQL